MKPISAIAVDDEPNALEIIRLHAHKVPFLNLKKTFRKALDAIDWLQHNEVDLVFLDINMPNLSGLKFRGLIGDKIKIIFTTAYSEYAVESYNQNALDYLLKPILFERFLKATLKMKGIKDHPNPVTKNQIYVKSGTKLYKLNIADILYLEKDGNYIHFHTPSRKVMARLNMNQALALLPEKLFLRIHKSYIVGLNHIDMLEGHYLDIGSKRIPVAKVYREMLLQKLK